MKFDGSRYLVGLLLPIALLAGIYARPFLNLWVGARFEPYAYLLQLFLIATLPLVFSILAQMAIGIGKIQVVAISVFVGSLVNLPLSYILTRQNGVSGVIWGTVLTTLISNFLILGVRGGAIGGGSAMLLFGLLEVAKTWVSGTPAGDDAAGLFGSFSIGVAGYLAIMLQIVFMALVTAFASRRTVNRTLSSID